MNKVSEQALWMDHLSVLKTSLDQGKPDAIRNIKAEIQRLHTEVVAFMSRATILDNAGHDSTRITELVTERESRIGDLSALLREMRLIPKDQDHGPTPEMDARPSQRDPIVILEEAERKRPGTGLTSDQARAAKEIAWISEGITMLGKAKIGQMTAAGRAQGYREPEFSAKVAEMHSMRYLPWIDWLHDNDPVTLDICIKVSVHGVGVKALMKKHRIGMEGVKDRLQRGLDRYWDHRELLPKYLDKVEASKREWNRRVG